MTEDEASQALADTLKGVSAFLHAHDAPDMLFNATETAIRVAQTRSWRCFHCDEVLTDAEAARDHFGPTLAETPVCQIPDLAHLLRLQEHELRGHREEDSQLIRRVAEVTSSHHRELQDEEEKGYARGLKDGRGLTADLVRQVRMMLANDGATGSECYHAFKLMDAREAVQKLLKDFPEDKD